MLFYSTPTFVHCTEPIITVLLCIVHSNNYLAFVHMSTSFKGKGWTGRAILRIIIRVFLTLRILTQPY